MTPKEKALAWVDEHFDECLAELKNAVACESYAGNEAGRNQTFRNISFAEQSGSEGINSKSTDEHGNTAIAEDHAGEDDGEDSLIFPDELNCFHSDTAGHARFFHDLAENGTEEEDREEGFDVGNGFSHEQFRIPR